MPIVKIASGAMTGSKIKRIFKRGDTVLASGASYELRLCMLKVDRTSSSESTSDDLAAALDADYQRSRDNSGTEISISDSGTDNYIFPTNAIAAWEVISSSADFELVVQTNV